jgi:hypothetical protein
MQRTMRLAVAPPYGSPNTDQENIMKPRRDYDTAKLIDASIAALRSQGMYVAARMLCEHGVPLEMAQRVLRQPSQRRTYGNAILH